MAKSLSNQLLMIRSNFSFGLFCFCFLGRLTPEKVVRMDRVIIGEDGLYCIPPSKTVPRDAGQYHEVIFGGASTFNLKKANMEFAKMLLRNFTLDLYEAVQRYCDKTGQASKIRAQPWYQFARMIRNSLTHTQRWDFRKADLKVLPVSWRGKKINASMNGQILSFTFYDWWDGCELYDEICAFANALA